MDAKITKKRIVGMLSYDWLKIVMLVVAIIFFWTIIFSTTATKITPAQQFTVFNHYANVQLTNDFYAWHDGVRQKGVFSYEVIETNVADLSVSGETYASSMLQSRLISNEGDVMFIPNIDDPSSAYTNESGTAVCESYLQTFYNAWAGKIFKLDMDAESGYFYNLEQYLNGFYGGDYQNGTLNEAKVTAAFETRIRANKDKRFKSKAQIEQGKRDELARIQNYRDALLAFYGYLDAGVVEFTKLSYKDENGAVLLEGDYALNLCPNTDTMGSLSKKMCYQKTLTGEDNKTQTVLTAENMHVLFFKLSGVEASFEYESLCYVVDLIEQCYTPAA